MKVKVEGCWSGGEKFSFRLTFKDRWGRWHREGVSGQDWTRKIASEALDILESLYNIPRRTVRFSHR